ncbi:MAG: tryptophan 7-halogenase [Thermoanaerobaculia bacterium]
MQQNPSPDHQASTGEERAGDEYDAVVIGGAFSGAAFTTLLRRWLPASRVLIVEQSERFDRKVGEATVEVSGFFLHRVLRLADHLAREHLSKHGLRFWLTDGRHRSLAEMTEVGARELPHVASYQLDRAKLDQHLLEVAGSEGCEVMRPARVIEVEHDWPRSHVRLDDGDGERRVRARWVIDASGRRAFLARRQRLLRRVEEHPTAAVWARWTGVGDMDGTAVLGRDPRAGRLPQLLSARRLATNHFCGYGWWCWIIPLSGGETSIGMVYNKELFELPGTGSKQQRYQDFVTSQDGLRELLADAVMVEGDCLSYNHLPYRSSRYAGRGWALLGDAAAFLDPLYSAGLDHVTISIYATARLVEQDLRAAGEENPRAGLDDAVLDHHNRIFVTSYGRWLEALYLGKYELLGDAELVTCAFLVDTALYYLAVVTSVYKDIETFGNPPFGIDKPQAAIAHRIMRAFSRRLCKLARMRRIAGTYGRRNAGAKIITPAFGLGSSSIAPLLRGIGMWLRLEAEHMFARLRLGWPDVSRPVPLETEARP